MRLPTFSTLPFGQKKTESNYFLVLTIGAEKASAVIFEESLGQIKVIGLEDVDFGKQIDEASDEEILNALDKAITTAEKNLPKDIQTQKTIFGVESSWVDGGKIKKEYLLRLKKISEELELTPVGFIVKTEAICHLLQKEEGAPVSAILTQIGHNILTVTLIRGGRIVESKSSEIHESPAFTLDTLLKHLTTAEVLPSRIIVLGDNSEKLNQEFVSFAWSKSLPFLHLPQITSLDNSFDAKAVLFGAANQMKFTISDLSMFKKSADSIEEISDFAIEDTKAPPEKYFGFVQNSDVSKKSAEENAVRKNQNFKEEVEEIPEELKINRAETKSLPSNAFLIFSGMKSTLFRLFKSLKAPQNMKIPLINRGGKLILIPALVIALLILLSLYYLLFRSAVVTVDVQAKEASKKEDVVFSTSAATDVSSSTIRGDFVSVSEDGKLSAPATGKKQTGDKAKGTVTIFNLSSASKSFTSGTVIESSNDLEFALDKSITVASQSGDATSPSPGKTDVAVTASTFGTDYNLPSGTKFSVGDNSTSVVAGKNDNAFSGGTKKDITVVSKEDQDKLSAKIVAELSDKAKEDIQKKSTSDKILIPDFVNTTFDLKSFSKDVGDESKDIAITATVIYQSIAYTKEDLISFSKELFAKELGRDELTISIDDTQVEINDINKKDSKNVSASLTIRTKIVPKLDTRSIAKKVQGKSFEDAGSALSDIPQKQNISIRLTPSIFFLPKILPNSSDKIKVVVNINE